MQGEEGKTAERPTRARLHDSTAGGIGIGPWPKNFPFCIALPWIKWPPLQSAVRPLTGLAWPGGRAAVVVEAAGLFITEQLGRKGEGEVAPRRADRAPKRPCLPGLGIAT